MNDADANYADRLGEVIALFVVALVVAVMLGGCATEGEGQSFLDTLISVGASGSWRAYPQPQPVQLPPQSSSTQCRPDGLGGVRCTTR